MKPYRKFSFQSLQLKLILGFLIIIVPIILFLICSNLYAIGVVRNQIAQSNENMVNLYMGQIDSTLARIDDYLYNFAAEDTDLVNLDLPEEGNNQKYYFSKIQLVNKISKDIDKYPYMDTIFIYSAINQDLMSTQHNVKDFQYDKTVQEALTQMLQSNETGTYRTDEWFMYPFHEYYFLCRVVRIGDVYVGVIRDAKTLMVPMNLINLGDQGKSLLTTEEFEPTDHEKFIQGNGISLQYKYKVYKLTGNREKYLVVGSKSSKGNFSLVAVIPDKQILEKLPYLQRINWVMLIGAIVILPMLYLFLRKMFLLPIHRIVSAMKLLKDGQLETRIPAYQTSQEFQLMNETFNSMASQIQELKIHVYEEQLNSQKAELRHLQLQINPHFFLNSLNIIYSLAQVKQYHLIQEMALSLVQYFRFMFRSNSDFVSLQDEIEHTRNYLRIQEMRFPNNLTYEVSVPDALLQCPVPPLLIQTFVENTIKHAVTMDEAIHIRVHIQLTDGNPGILRIQIHDTGKGFSEDVLQHLQKHQGILNEQGEHIGIWNVHRRLKLLYEKKASILFSNGHDGGAVVTIYFPLHQHN